MSETDTSSVETMYLPQHGEINPGQVARAYEYVHNHVLQSGYKKELGNGVGENLIRVIEWSQDQSAARTGDLQRAQGHLKEFFDIYENLFIDITDRMLLEKNDPEFKLMWAKFNQQLAADFLVAYQTNDTDMNKGIDTFLKLSEVLSQKGEPAFNEIRSRSKGAKVQAALVNYFTNEGHLVFTPDPDNDEEILKWDIRTGVDFAVITRQGKVTLVGARNDFMDKLDIGHASPKEKDLYDTELPKVVQAYTTQQEQTKYNKNIQAYLTRMNQNQDSLTFMHAHINADRIQADGTLPSEVVAQLKGKFQ